jgi:hypothetical protein
MRASSVLLVMLVAGAIFASPGRQTHSYADATPTPRPTQPLNLHRLTIHHTFRGVPALSTLSLVPDVYADGTLCRAPFEPIYYPVLGFQIGWPQVDKRPCNEVGAMLSICSPDDLCSDEFAYTGEDASIEIAYPDNTNLKVPTAHFVRNGQPQPVAVGDWAYKTDTGYCMAAGGAPSIVTEIAYLELSGSCAQNGATVEAQFSNELPPRLVGSFVWNGENVDFDVEVPADVPPTPLTTPAEVTPTPLATPATLPGTGGSSEVDRSWLPLAADVALGTVVMTFGAWILARRRAR